MLLSVPESISGCPKPRRTAARFVRVACFSCSRAATQDVLSTYALTVPVVSEAKDLRALRVRLDARLRLRRQMRRRGGTRLRPREERERSRRKALSGRLPPPPCTGRRRAAGFQHRGAGATPSCAAGLGLAGGLGLRDGAKIGDLAVGERGHRPAGHAGNAIATSTAIRRRKFHWGCHRANRRRVEGTGIQARREASLFFFFSSIQASKRRAEPTDFDTTKRLKLFELKA